VQDQDYGENQDINFNPSQYFEPIGICSSTNYHSCFLYKIGSSDA